MNEAIKVSNLSKSYGTHVVLNGLDFCVQQREIFALQEKPHLLNVLRVYENMTTEALP